MRRPNRKSTQRSPTKRSRRGATLLDVALGSMLLSLLLIPSVKLIGESKSNNRRLTLRDTMIFEADQLVEQSKATMADPAAFAAAIARPIDVKQALNQSTSPDLYSRTIIARDATVPASLLTINVQVWQDTNGNRRYDSGEPQEILRTQWAQP